MSEGYADESTLLRALEAELEAALAPPAPPEARLWATMRYGALGGGKRVRGRLALRAAEAVGGDWRRALPAAAAVEMVHAYSLIHDDLPCMDDADTRRGKDSAHIAFGEALAVLAGDGLQSRAFEWLLGRLDPPAPAARCGALLARALGPMGMALGQTLDIAPPEPGNFDAQARVRLIHRLKTAALIRACCLIGGEIASATEAQRAILGQGGEALGLAFQIADDLLDLRGEAAALGKAVGKDERLDRLGYPAVFGAEAADDELARQSAIAAHAFATLPRPESLLAMTRALETRSR